MLVLVVDDAFELRRVKRCSSHECSVDIWLGHEVVHRVGSNAAAILWREKEVTVSPHSDMLVS